MPLAGRREEPAEGGEGEGRPVQAERPAKKKELTKPKAEEKGRAKGSRDRRAGVGAGPERAVTHTARSASSSLRQRRPAARRVTSI